MLVEHLKTLSFVKIAYNHKGDTFRCLEFQDQLEIIGCGEGRKKTLNIEWTMNVHMPDSETCIADQVMAMCNATLPIIL